MNPIEHNQMMEPEDHDFDDFASEADRAYDELKDNVATGTASPDEVATWARLEQRKAERACERRNGGGG